MIRVFNGGGWARSPEVYSTNHGGVLFTVQTEADLQRFLRMFPEERGHADALRAEIGLSDSEPEPVSMPAPAAPGDSRGNGKYMTLDVWFREDVTRILAEAVVARDGLTSDERTLLAAIGAGFGIDLAEVLPPSQVVLPRPESAEKRVVIINRLE